MTLRGDSYSSAADVFTLTKHLSEGESAFNTTTDPSLTEVEGIIDEVSGVLNVAYRKYGFAPAAIKANSTATQSADSWTRTWATSFVELTAPFQGLTGNDEDRSSLMRSIYEDADTFVMTNAKGYKQEGVAVSVADSDGISFTGKLKQSDRPDRTDSTLEQPLFDRHQFDN